MLFNANVIDLLKMKQGRA